MLAVTFVQVVFAIVATFYGARSAMGFGRDVRRDLFHTVMEYSAREVGQFGAPSLITRITNDVTQVQVFVLMSLHPVHHRADHDRSAACSSPSAKTVRCR